MGLAIFLGLTASTLVVGVTLITGVNVHPRLLGPYLERRAAGNNPLLVSTAARIAGWLHYLDRGAERPLSTYPAWALAVASTKRLEPAAADAKLISSGGALHSAMREAQPSAVLQLAPGLLRTDRSLTTGHAGRRGRPITVRGHRSGKTRIESNTLQAIFVTQPYWRFENFQLRGVCKSHSQCEHAFHVVGQGSFTEIRSTTLADFDTAIKVNADSNGVPDEGLIANNRIYNTTARETRNPVSGIDIVAASRWRVQENLIADLIKASGNRVSYAAYAKGAGQGNVFERNVVLCEARLRGQAGRRIGLSLGGGGTEPRYCRDKRCIYEQLEGAIVGNVIASCSDEGLYLNSAARSRIIRNTVLNTSGVHLHFPATTAALYGNLIDGPIRLSGDAGVLDEHNLVPWLPLQFLGRSSVRELFVNQARLDLRWRTATPTAPTRLEREDICGQRRVTMAAMGAFENIQNCLR